MKSVINMIKEAKFGLLMAVSVGSLIWYGLCEVILNYAPDWFWKLDTDAIYMGLLIAIIYGTCYFWMNKIKKETKSEEES